MVWCKRVLRLAYPKEVCGISLLTRIRICSVNISLFKLSPSEMPDTPAKNNPTEPPMCHARGTVSSLRGSVCTWGSGGSICERGEQRECHLNLIDIKEHGITPAFEQSATRGCSFTLSWLHMAKL